MSKTPKLRFKEFSGDWESKYGENIATKITKGSSPKWQGFNYQSEGVLFVTSENVRDGYLDISEPKYLPLEFNEKQKSSSLVKGDILINIVGASIGRICEFNLDNVIANVNQAVCVLRVENETTRKFINYHLQTSKIKKVLFGTQTESARPNLSLADIRGLEFNLPKTKEEQEKIASFFSLIDEKISLQGEKVEALKDYKRGMMQKIFGRELRFKDDEGRDYPDWEEKKLGDCIDTITDYVAAGSFATIRENVQYKNNKDYAQLIRTVDLKNKFKNNDNFIYVDKNAFEFLYRVNLDEESIILPNVGNIGEVYFVNPESLPNEKNVLAPNSILLRSYKNDNAFLYQLFNTKKFRDSLDIITSKSGQPKFNKTELKEIKLNIPIRQEQVKIAKFLENIDFKIEKEQEKLNSLNQYKKGLLQQMFV